MIKLFFFEFITILLLYLTNGYSYDRRKKIGKQALKLSSQERAELAHMLIDSLRPDKEFESEDAWSKELKKRIDRYEQDKSSAKPWCIVKKSAVTS